MTDATSYNDGSRFYASNWTQWQIHSDEMRRKQIAGTADIRKMTATLFTAEKKVLPVSSMQI